MIDYKTFNSLNLSAFATLEIVEQASSYEYLEQYWDGETFGFTASLTSTSKPLGRKCLIMDLNNNDDALGERLLHELDLGITAGVSFSDLKQLFGSPIEELIFVADRVTYTFVVMFDVAYNISCTVHQSKGLIYISIVNV